MTETPGTYVCGECGRRWDKTLPDDEAPWRADGICPVCWARRERYPETVVKLTEVLSRVLDESQS